MEVTLKQEVFRIVGNGKNFDQGGGGQWDNKENQTP
jgi:hypothetical protein